nr:unnamed protein product [Callosobruchus analis]
MSSRRRSRSRSRSRDKKIPSKLRMDTKPPQPRITGEILWRHSGYKSLYMDGSRSPSPRSRSRSRSRTRSPLPPRRSPRSPPPMRRSPRSPPYRARSPRSPPPRRTSRGRRSSSARRPPPCAPPPPSTLTKVTEKVAQQQLHQQLFRRILFCRGRSLPPTYRSKAAWAVPVSASEARGPSYDSAYDARPRSCRLPIGRRTRAGSRRRPGRRGAGGEVIDVRGVRPSKLPPSQSASGTKKKPAPPAEKQKPVLLKRIKKERTGPKRPGSPESSASDDSAASSPSRRPPPSLLRLRFSKIAQWSADRERRGDIENMRITKTGGSMKVMVGEEYLYGSPTRR